MSDKFFLKKKPKRKPPVNNDRAVRANGSSSRRNKHLDEEIGGDELSDEVGVLDAHAAFSSTKQPRKRNRESNEEDDNDGSQSTSETADEKRARLARGYIRKVKAVVGKQLKDTDASSNDEQTSDDASQLDADTADAIAKQLDEDVLEAAGRKVRRVAARIRIDEDDSLWLKGLSTSVTCVATTDEFVVAGSKNGSIMQWSSENGKKVYQYRGGRAPVKNGGHSGAVLCIDVSTDGQYMLSGGVDKIVRMWDLHKHVLLDTFPGHRDTVTGVVFRRNTHQFYSASSDRCVKVWDGDERAYVETLFGHQAPIQAITAMNKERCLTVSDDRSVRIWKILEESQLVFRGHRASIDCTAQLDDSWFVTGSQDGAIALWNVGKKRPTATYAHAHKCDQGTHGWISSCAAMPHTDLCATGSCDGRVRLWRVERRKRKLMPARRLQDLPKQAPINEVDESNDDDDNDNDNTTSVKSDTKPVPVGVTRVLNASSFQANGFVNGISFAPNGTFMVCALSSEPRLGRWSTIKSARNGILLQRLRYADHDNSE